MYFTGCFIVFLIVLLIVYTKGDLTVRDIVISLLCIVFSWMALIIFFLGLLAILVIFISEFWNTSVWKAKQKSKLLKKLETILKK